MNWANRLTVARLFFTFVFVVALSTEWPYGKTTGLALFLLASITDYADGKIARRFNMITDFGKLMDPLVDKIMIAAAFICLVPLKAIPAWAVIIIISREFLITGLRMLALSKGKVLPAEKMGKHKTAWQMITAVYFLLVLTVREFRHERPLPEGWYCSSRASWLGAALIVCTLGFTLYSGIGYLWKNRALLRTE
ncbi:MAG TPA: CDP-diacylglycerol--glycerol-3-phosphate 3-phosphatidyltransferase [Chthoniobacteraceae bacterium]|nr:CDP-diacylglycerol--glycerol-3-phosphate 3-phosphatidyltransferase [Chthoniobacteraceae bacterium]